MEKDVKILAIESSCDETSAAVVVNGRNVLSNIIYSQIDIHTLYGGVVPEIASRKHIENIDGVIDKALSDAGVTFASAEVTMIPQTTVDLTSEDDIKKMNRILGLLDEDDDVQNVYHNWNEPEEDEE